MAPAIMATRSSLFVCGLLVFAVKASSTESEAFKPWQISMRMQRHRNRNRPINPSDYLLPALVPKDGLGAPLNLFFAMITVLTPPINLHETPISVRATAYYDVASWACVAAFQSSWTDPFRKNERPIVGNIPPTLGNIPLHTTDPRAICTAYSWFWVTRYLMPDDTALYITALERFGFKFSEKPDQQIEKCFTRKRRQPALRRCVENYAKRQNFRPEIVGQTIARSVIQYAQNDGWNQDGSIGSDGTRCTANCRPFSDYTGYTPRNHPGTTKFWWNWRPLLEDNGKGFSFRQEHVTPHIGTEAKHRFLQDAVADRIKAPPPRYNYRREQKLVLKRLRNLTDKQKMEIEFFDDKIAVAVAIISGIFAKVGPAMTFERVTHFFVGFAATQVEATLLIWKEKIRYDLVRPTTLLQDPRRNGGFKRFLTFAGPGEGVGILAAKDFQPYIRVMPHAEYPSGSAGICQGMADYAEEWFQTAFPGNGMLSVQQQFAAGSSKVESGITPAANITLSYDNLDELRVACGQSRLNGGMHFTASVPAGYNLIKGVATKGFAYAQSLGDIKDV